MREERGKDNEVREGRDGMGRCGRGLKGKGGREMVRDLRLVRMKKCYDER